MATAVERFKINRNKLVRFMMKYQFALKELETKLDILKTEFRLLHDYNPIEHTGTRIKSPESILKKLQRKGGDLSLSGIQEKVRDIAGMRIVCSFVSDIYRIADLLKNQNDLNVVEVEDYINNPKPNGYQSLHMLVEVPVFMSDRCEMVVVEVQIRTIAMDFWASLEHKIFYKFNGVVPPGLREDLKEAADTAHALDKKMESLHREVQACKPEQPDNAEQAMAVLLSENHPLPFPRALLEIFEADARK